jgi:isoleucyl-tRNA synthetase
MSKLQHQAVQVSCNNQGLPLRLQKGQQTAQVEQVLDCWRDTGCWWEGESEKLFYRLSLDNQAIVEIYWDHRSQVWMLYKIYD